jgi:hypothetical protein
VQVQVQVHVQVQVQVQVHVHVHVQVHVHVHVHVHGQAQAVPARNCHALGPLGAVPPRLFVLREDACAGATAGAHAARLGGAC